MPLKIFFMLLQLVATADTVAYFEDQYNNMTIRYGDLKKQLADDMVQFIAPLSEKINMLKNDDAYINKVIAMGKEKSRHKRQ
jgi:tryptophanyl-tRNA synthetase